MATRLIKDSIWTSPNLNKLSVEAERHFYRLLPLPDDYGCFVATEPVLRGLVYPLKSEITDADIVAWNKELQEQKLISLWTEDGRSYGVFLKWYVHQRVRSFHKRKTPKPPDWIESINDTSRRESPQSATDDRSYLNLNLNPNLNPNHINTCSSDDELFETFWKAYPRKTAKGNARKAWKKLKDKKRILELALAALEWQRNSIQWTRDDGQYIPHPATYLNQSRWEDQPDGNKITNRGHDNVFLRAIQQEDERSARRRMGGGSKKIPGSGRDESGPQSNGGVQ